MERAREGALTFSDCRAVVVLRPRTFHPTTPARINTNYRELFSAMFYDLAERAQTAADIVADFHEAAASGESLDRLLLRRSPLKPTRYLCPVHSNRLDQHRPRDLSSVPPEGHREAEDVVAHVVLN